MIDSGVGLYVDLAAIGCIPVVLLVSVVEVRRFIRRIEKR